MVTDVPIFQQTFLTRHSGAALQHSDKYRFKKSNRERPFGIPLDLVRRERVSLVMAAMLYWDSYR
mgnify:CR=1 FL=1